MVERRFKLRAAALILASLAMLLSTAMPALAAQAPGGSATGDPAPAIQPEPAQVSPAEPTVSTPAEPLAEPPAEAPLEPSVGPPAGVPGNCDHAAGEFLVGYVSEEALGVAPQGNVVETFDGILAQHLVFEDIKNIADPAARLAAEEAKRQELAAQPGVAYAEYNCIAEVNQAAAADEGASIPLPTRPASCGDCGRSVVEGARKIISEGFQGAGSKDAFNAALLAARTADDEDNVAFASELELDEDSAEDQYTGDAGSSDEGSTDSDSTTDNADSESDAADSESDDADNDTTTEDDTESSEGETGSDAKSEAEEESGSGAGEKAADAESSDDEDVASGEDTSGEDAAVEPGEGGGTGPAGTSDAGPVSGKNAAASEEPGVVSGPRVLALGAGGLLLAAGVFVGRRILGA